MRHYGNQVLGTGYCTVETFKEGTKYWRVCQDKFLAIWEDVDGTDRSSSAKTRRNVSRGWISNSLQLATGIYVPYMPEPRFSDVAFGPRDDVLERQEKYYAREFQRVLQTMFEPQVWRNDITDRFPFLTFDLRFFRGCPNKIIDKERCFEPPRIIVLIKATAPNVPNKEDAAALIAKPNATKSSPTSKDTYKNGVEQDSKNPSEIEEIRKKYRNPVKSKSNEALDFRSSDVERIKRRTQNDYDETLKDLENTLDDISERIRALLPFECAALPTRWRTVDSSGAPLTLTEPIVDEKEGVAYISPKLAGLDGAYRYSAEVRRTQILQTNSKSAFSSYWDYVDSINDGETTPLPTSWPSADVNMLGVFRALFSCSDAVALSVRVQPTLLTQCERDGIKEKKLKEYKNSTLCDIKRARDRLEEILNQDYLYQFVVQVASDSRASALKVAHSYVAEFSPSETRGGAKSKPRALNVVEAWTESETKVAKFNFNNMEFAPWGNVDKKTHKVGVTCAPETSLVGNDGDVIDQISFLPDSSFLGLPAVYLSRDAETDPRTSRLRYLATEDEFRRIWQLPIVPPGGYYAIKSRIPDPFERLPEPTAANGDSISLGKVQFRGHDSTQDFRVPFAPWDDVQETPGVAGIGDKTIVVAGSPGSGKTNFCLSLLEQIWFERDVKYRCPFLVLDPTRGNEFRSLLDGDSEHNPRQTEDVLVFTVGDTRCSPFCFNPFKVPKDVSVQSHINRLTTCFRAAYEMWDPLPAIFEMAFRLAYKGKRQYWWAKKNGRKPEEWSPSRDFADGSEGEPFPTLQTVVDAMGDGSETTSVFIDTGEPTIMSSQKEMWGGQTENAHTIVASTYLRLKTIKDNYGHILCGDETKSRCVNLYEIMKRPTILEFGTLGDSNALALVMSFLICSLVGIIEGRGTPDRGLRHMLVLEEAHRLLGVGTGVQDGANSKVRVAEDLNNMLAEVRKYGESAMIIDQRPGSLVGGVIDNAYLVALHRLNEEKGFEQFINQLNLNSDQQRYARSELKPGQAITLDRRSGSPTLFRPENKKTSAAKTTDKKLKDLMAKRVEKILEPTSFFPTKSLDKNERAIIETVKSYINNGEDSEFCRDAIKDIIRRRKENDNSDIDDNYWIYKVKEVVKKYNALTQSPDDEIPDMILKTLFHERPN